MARGLWYSGQAEARAARAARAAGRHSNQRQRHLVLVSLCGRHMLLLRRQMVCGWSQARGLTAYPSGGLPRQSIPRPPVCRNCELRSLSAVWYDTAVTLPSARETPDSTVQAIEYCRKHNTVARLDDFFIYS
jgi:hypothetical protein